MLDTSDAEGKIEKLLNDDGIPVTSVDCPSDQKLEKGHTFECTAKDADGRGVRVKVTETDDDGKVSLQTSTVYAPTLEAYVNQNIPGAGRARCADDVPLTDGHADVECTANINGTPVTLVVSVENGTVTNVVQKTDSGTQDPPADPVCVDFWSGGTDPVCDQCAAAHCCAEMVDCQSGSACSDYALCVSDHCAANDTTCVDAQCGQLTDGKQAAKALVSCMASFCRDC
jgi:hypothetical protein